MTINRLFIPIFVVAAVLVLSSCQSYEDRVITKLNHLSERIDADGKNFDAGDWEEALEELADIHEDMADCEFTPEQLRKLGKVDGQLSVIIMREGSRAAGKSVTDFIRSAGSFFKGFEEGSKESYEENKDEFEQIGNDVESSINEVLKELDDL